MIRFDIVVANRNRTQVFWQGWKNFKNFDIAKDRIVFLNTSADPMKELAICLYYIDHYGLKGCNFLFLMRRSWNSVFGMIADYTRLVGEDVLEAPMHAFFMQDHYVCKTDFVAGDTLGDDQYIDFNVISEVFKKDNKLVVGSTRHGFRLCASVPDELAGRDFETYEDNDRNPKPNLPWIFMPGKLGSILYEKYCCDHFIYYHGGYHIEGSQDICIDFDGLNFCCDPQYIVNHYKENKHLYSETLGDYGEALIWETRIGKILYDQGLGFHELSRNVTVKDTAELKRLDPNPGTAPSSLWCYHYSSPLFYALHYSEDVWPYKFKQTEAYFRYQKFCEEWKKTMEKDSKIYLIFDSKPYAANFKGEYRTDLPDLFVNKMEKSIKELSQYDVFAVRTELAKRFYDRKIKTPIKNKYNAIMDLPGRILRKANRLLNEQN